MSTIPLTRNQIEHVLRSIAPTLDRVLFEALDERVGFFLYVGNFEPPAKVAYVTNVRQEDMIDALDEWVQLQRAGIKTDPPGDRGET